MENHNAGLSLVCRVQARRFALPIAHVVETMRPLPVEVLPRTPAYILGLAIIRGTPVPVIDTARLLGAGAAPGARFVTVKVGARQVALAVGEVLGVQSIPPASLRGLPPLLRDASADVVATIGVLDAELLLILHSARWVPEDLWAELDAGEVVQ
ncbi:MAG TPA: chemotaxis protein CheW [Burkholderiaceae bacterium]|nr:chemotaxis protein CheW [Burkholderiaceae bacterium]